MQEVHEQILKVLTSYYGTPTADQRDHIASMAGAVMSEAVAPELERLKAELARRQDDHAGSVWDCRRPECFDETCGDCIDGRCHGSGPCGCARHEVSVQARQRHKADADEALGSES